MPWRFSRNAMHEAKSITRNLKNGAGFWRRETRRPPATVPMHCASGAFQNSIISASFPGPSEAREPGIHMWTAPCSQEVQQRADRIACDHMSGLLSRSHMTAAKMGFSRRESRTVSRFRVLPLGSTDYLTSRSNRSHHLLLLEQAPASARGEGRSHAELIMGWTSRSSPDVGWCAMRARGAARSPQKAQRHAPRGWHPPAPQVKHSVLDDSALR
jgi:hypothetical protein